MNIMVAADIVTITRYNSIDTAILYSDFSFCTCKKWFVGVSRLVDPKAFACLLSKKCLGDEIVKHELQR